MARANWRKELSAITGLADLGGTAIANQVESQTGLPARVIGQIFHHNETYVKNLGTIHLNRKGQGRGVMVYQLTNEGWYLILKKRGKSHA